MVQSVAIASIPIYSTWQLLKSVYRSGHISPGLLNEIHRKYFNVYGSVRGSDHQGTGTGLFRTEPTVRSKVRYMVRTEPRVQFSVLQILLWTWPDRTLTALPPSPGWGSETTILPLSPSTRRQTRRSPTLTLAVNLQVMNVHANPDLLLGQRKLMVLLDRYWHHFARR